MLGAWLLGHVKNVQKFLVHIIVNMSELRSIFKITPLYARTERADTIFTFKLINSYVYRFSTFVITYSIPRWTLQNHPLF